MVDLPTIVYKNKGPHQRTGGTYSYLGVNTEAEYLAALENGWVPTLAEVVDPAQKQDDNKNNIPEDDAPATRQELELKATEMGIKFDGRTPDKKLSSMIDEALKA